MTARIITLVLLTALFYSACAPSKFYPVSRADKPLFVAINKLYAHPEDMQWQNNFRELYAKTIAYHENAIKNINTSDDERRYHRILFELEALQHIYNSLQSLPVALTLVKPRDYSTLIGYIVTAKANYETCINNYYSDLDKEECVNQQQ